MGLSVGFHRSRVMLFQYDASGRILYKLPSEAKVEIPHYTQSPHLSSHSSFFSSPDSLVHWL